MQFDNHGPAASPPGGPRAALLAMAMQQAQALRGNPKPQASYSTGTQNQEAYRQALGRRGIQATPQMMHDKANTYAQQRLSQFGKVADLMGGGFADAYHGQDMSDPAAAYRALSGLFSQQSQSQGVADPRVMLAQLLMQARQGGGAAQGGPAQPNFHTPGRQGY